MKNISERPESILCISGIHDLCHVDGCECSCHAHVTSLHRSDDSYVLMSSVCRELIPVLPTITSRRIGEVLEKCLNRAGLPFTSDEITGGVEFLVEFSRSGDREWSDEDLIAHLRSGSGIQTQTLF